MFLESIISLAHSLQIKTIAKGIETKEEFLTIKSLGCHYAQGYFISKPEIDTEKIKTSYLEKIIKKEKREKKSNYKKYIIIEDFITPNSKVETILDKFKNQTLEYLPVLNENFNPIGYIDYKDIRGYITNQYGISILKNERNKEGNLNFIISPAVIIDINENINNIISIFAKNNHKNLIIITENEKYYGILTPNELINIIYEQKLLEAKDLNPLTSLPGNRLVTNFMKRFIGNKATTVVYFDFNDFKPFNDTYGFRTGDRAIFMFSDILQKNKGSNFIGHIGGDDFFMGFVDKDFEEIYEITNKIVKKFKIEAESLYKEKDIKNGYIISKDREGNKNKFPLLSVSAAILEFELNDIFNEDTISEILGSLKKEAKKSDNNIAIAHKLMI
jgi:diguanylate cyclase (GGDEF)-like protein